MRSVVLALFTWQRENLLSSHAVNICLFIFNILDNEIKKKHKINSFNKNNDA